MPCDPLFTRLSEHRKDYMYFDWLFEGFLVNLFQIKSPLARA